jgi:hypothetical protein
MGKRLPHSVQPGNSPRSSSVLYSAPAPTFPTTRVDAGGHIRNLLLTAKPHFACGGINGSSQANGEFAVLKFTMRPRSVAGPAGPLTINDLPPPTAAYWVPRRKAELLAAIDGGLIGLSDACARYRLSDEELGSWRRALGRAGVSGLRVTKLRHVRDQMIG